MMKLSMARWVIRLGTIAFVTACFIVFLDAGLNEPDEGRYAEIGREMALPGGDWFTPHLNGFPHFQKPPLVYWCTALSLKLFGTHEWAARLPSASAALGTLALTSWIARTIFGHGLHRTTMLVLSSCAGFFWSARLLTPDMLLTFWVTAAIACAVRRQFGGGEFWGFAFFAAMGFGFMTKGPMAIVVPVCAVIGMRWPLPHSDRSRIPWILGIIITLGIGLWWFIALSRVHSKLFRYFAGYELLQRFASGTHGRDKPFWFFLVVLPIAFLPWSAWLIGPARDFWRRRRQGARIGSRAGLLMGWIVPPLLILSVSGSKLPTYILPLLPALALAVVAWSRAHGQHARAIRLTAVGMLTLLVVSASLRDTIDPLLAQQSDTRDLADLVRAEPDFQSASLFAADVRAHGFTFATGRLTSVTADEADLVLKPTPEQRERLFKDKFSLEQAMVARPVAYGIVRRKDFGTAFPASHWKELGSEGDFLLIGLKRITEPRQ